MNREFKFRVWLEDENNMIYLPLHHSNWGTVNKRHVVMQFTGLKDKNGKDIYEGDILSVQKSHLMFGSDIIRYVAYVEQSGKFHLIGTLYDNLYKGIYDINGKNCATVIGNVYENPELLNGT